MRDHAADENPREHAVRFIPPADGSSVPAELYVETLRNVVEGLGSLRQTIAPQLAGRHRISLAEVKSVLEMSIGPTSRGSLLVSVQFGESRGIQPALLPEYRRIEATFWRTAGQSLQLAARGRDREMISASAADRFASAGAAAQRCNTGLELAERRVMRGHHGPWRATVSISKIHAGLRAFAARRKEGMRSRIERIGRVTEISFEPLTFRLRLDEDRITVRARAGLREDIRRNWGANVRVTMDALVDSVGNVSDPEALTLSSLEPTGDLVVDYHQSRGSGTAIWASEEAQQYLATLRSRPNDDR